MNELATDILVIIKDYRNDDGIQLTEQSIIDWVQQFGEDALFVLTELKHIVPQVYLSKSTAKAYLKRYLQRIIKQYRYTSVPQFLMDTEFLDMQREGKSQKAILGLVEEVLQDDYQESYQNYVTYPKQNFIYFDDVLATGKTVSTHLIKWLNEEHSQKKNYEKIIDKESRLFVHLFCVHTWGLAFQKFRIKSTFPGDIESKIVWSYDYEIQNHIKWNNQKLNIAIPTEDQPGNVKSYLAGLSAEKYEDYAYRKTNTPTQENFFTSPQNRIKYENLLLQKGLSIMNKIQGEVKPNIRPLGFIHPNYKTYGLGTHFFTWRNIPNNSPLVFWWEVPGHNWKPLFPVGNRGN